MKKLTRLIVLALIPLLAFPAACAKKTESPVIKADYYPNCYGPLAYLHERATGAASSVAKGAATGGVLSGIAAVIASAITGRVSGLGVAAGVAAGAAVGGISTGVASGEAMSKEDNKRLSQYLEEIDGDIEGMDLKTASATVARQCYRRAFKTLLADARSGKIGPVAAGPRLSEIIAGDDEASQLLNEKSDSASMEAEYDQAIRSRRGK